MRLKDKVAIVTGSALGIGKAIANRFASEGARVVIADKNEGAIPSAVAEIEAAGGAATGFVLDVSDRAQTHMAMSKIVETRGRVDILVNNAGITRYRPFLTATAEDWNVVLGIDGLLAGDKWVLGPQYSVADPYTLVIYGWGRLHAMRLEELKHYPAFKDRMLRRPAVRTVLEQEQSRLLQG